MRLDCLLGAGLYVLSMNPDWRLTPNCFDTLPVAYPLDRLLSARNYWATLGMTAVR